MCTFDSQIHGRFVSNSWRILRFRQTQKRPSFMLTCCMGQKWDEPQIWSGLVWYYPFWRGLSQILSHTHLSLSKNRPLPHPLVNHHTSPIEIASTCRTSKGHHWTSASPPRQSCSIPDLAPERGDFFALKKKDDLFGQKKSENLKLLKSWFFALQFSPHEKNGLVVLETAREADKDTPLLMG